MGWRLIFFLFLLVCTGAFAGKKAVKIVQEPANYGGLQSQRTNNHGLNGNSMLKPFRKPQHFSGPRHLQKLYGKCFTLTDKSYLYQLCPFCNITQHEQTWRWNAFHGILGIWKEWSIVNNTFEAMVMTEGDPCPGDVRRQSNIFLKCANSSKLVSVKEPKTCQYEVVFETPLACPVDAFLVYPLLSREHQREWQEIERSFYHKELTKQGYQKLRRNLFLRAGLLIPVEQNKVADNQKEKDHQSPVTTAHPEFKTKDECSKAYSELLHKYEKLVQPHKNKISTTDNTSKDSQISNTTSVNLNRARGDYGTI